MMTIRQVVSRMVWGSSGLNGFASSVVRGRAAFAPLLILAALIGAPAAVAQGAAAKPNRSRHAAINVLIAGHAASPVLRAVSSSKSGGFQVDRTSAPPGSSAAPFANRGRYRVLIVDGDNLTPRQMARHRAIRRFADSGRWVLAFDLRRGHFRRAIGKLTGFSGLSRARVFMFRRIFANGSPRVQMIAAPNLLPRGAGRLGKRRRQQLVRGEAARLGGFLRSTVRTDAGNLGERPAATSSAESSVVPPELQHVAWSYTQTGSEVPPEGFWTKARRPPFGSAIHVNGHPAPGHQVATWVFTHEFDVYLDNGEGKPQGNEQIVTYNLDGEFSPRKPDGSFFQMYNSFWVGLNKNPGVDLERAWWTGSVGSSVEPESATNEKLIWLGNQPATEDATTTYTSGEEFEVGFSASEEGASVSASYKVSNEKTQTIPDWGVESQTSGNHLDWLFSSRNCDVRSNHYNEERCFDLPSFTKVPGTPNLPSGLSLGQVQVNASGRWRTKGVLGPGNGSLSFNVATPVTIADTYCNGWDLGNIGCTESQRKLDTKTIGPRAQQYGFDASAVVPIPVESLKLSPSPASCTEKGECQAVAGTVTLARPAAMDLKVVIYSDSENAVVGGPSGRGSQRIISIAKGSRTGTFEVQTNDNKLSPGQHTTASITAFYAEPTTVPLRIEVTK
jgi:hypothetical protein